jgi:hypothetical protein
MSSGDQMRLFLMLAGALLIGIMPGLAFDPQEFLNAYPPAEIKNFADPSTQGDSPCKSDICFNATAPKFSAAMTITGKIRAIPKAQKSVLKILSKINILNTWIPNFLSEIEVREGEKVYWLPINKVLMPKFENLKGQEAILGLRYLGCCYAPNQPSLIFIVDLMPFPEKK